MAMRDDFDELDAWFKRRTVDIEAQKARRGYAAWRNLSSPRDDGVIVGSEGRDSLEGAPKGDQLAPAPGRWPKLTGHPGLPAAVAGAVNVITSGPNTDAQVNTGKTRVDIRRGSGVDVQASAEVPMLGRVTASGNLAPPTRRKEVAVANVQGKPTTGVLESFPNKVRLYNDEKGRLLYEVSPGITVRAPKLLGGGKVRLVQEGNYVIK